MASVTRNFLRPGTIRIEMSEDAAEALMQAIQDLSHEGENTANREVITAEYDEVWNGLVDLFDVDDNYNSKRFGFKADETATFDL
jgi:hypothetical protein